LTAVVEIDTSLRVFM